MIRVRESSLIDRSRSWLKWSRDLARERGCHVLGTRGAHFFVVRWSLVYDAAPL